MSAPGCAAASTGCGWRCSSGPRWPPSASRSRRGWSTCSATPRMSPPTPSLLIVMAGTGVLRGLQNARTPLVVSVAMFAGNGVLCALLVLVLDLGIAGSAWATVVAQGGGAAVYVAVVVRAARREGVRLAPDAAGLRASAASGAALFVRTVSLRVVLVVTTAVAARMGDADIAAQQVVFQLWSLLVFAMDAIAVAGQAIIGRYLGASDAAGARSATRR